MVCRLILAYVAENCETIVYPLVLDNESSIFAKEKCKLDLDFPNLPYYIDGDLKLTQSMSIVRHLGRKYHLYGENQAEASRIDTILEYSMFLKQGLIDIASKPEFVCIIFARISQKCIKIQNGSCFRKFSKENISKI